MQSRIEPVSNLLHGIIESTRLNQTPAELRNRVTQLEERNAALEMASNTASFQQIEQQRILEGLQAQLQKEKEKQMIWHCTNRSQSSYNERWMTCSCSWTNNNKQQPFPLSCSYKKAFDIRQEACLWKSMDQSVEMSYNHHLHPTLSCISLTNYIESMYNCPLMYPDPKIPVPDQNKTVG